MSTDHTLSDQIATIFGQRPRRIGPLSGGCVGEVYRVEMPDKVTWVAKVDRSRQPVLGREAYMLNYLSHNSDLPVPKVLFGSDHLLVIEFLPGDSYFSAEAQVHAADLLADLHDTTAPAFGLDEDDLIGGLHQPNTWSNSWLEFFREHRLIYMSHEAMAKGRLPRRLFERLQNLADRLDNWLEEPERPSLIHGDVWTTNILAQNNKISGFLDPAIYYADPEIELAFITLFNTFAQPFFKRYQERRPIRAGFWEERRDLYNLYPLLVHVRLFGGGYVGSVERTLSRFGC